MAAYRFREELAGSPLLNPVTDEATWRRFRQRLQEMTPPCDEVQSADALPVSPGYRAVTLRSLLR